MYIKYNRNIKYHLKILKVELEISPADQCGQANSEIHVKSSGIEQHTCISIIQKTSHHQKGEYTVHVHE